MLPAYPKEAVIAEKLEARTKLGLLTSHVKDYYGVALLFRMYLFDGDHRDLPAPGNEHRSRAHRT